MFVIATANDIAFASLPPELMRKGRFDEILIAVLYHAFAGGTELDHAAFDPRR